MGELKKKICKHVRMRNRVGQRVMMAGYHLWAPLLQGNTFVTLEIIDDVELWAADGTNLPSESPDAQSLGAKPQRKDGGRGAFCFPHSCLITVVKIQRKLRRVKQFPSTVKIRLSQLE